MKKALVYEPFSPQKSAHVQDGNMLKQVKKNDILLFYPYESMDPFLKLIKDAEMCIRDRHNTVRGAAGGAVLCAEALTAKGYIQAK